MAPDVDVCAAPRARIKREHHCNGGRLTLNRSSSPEHAALTSLHNEFSFLPEVAPGPGHALNHASILFSR